MLNLRSILQKEGYIPRVLIERPATYKMLKMVYDRSGESDIDKYFQDSPAGQALRSRLNAVIEYGVENIPVMIAQNGKIKIANYGSGDARDVIGIVEKLKPELQLQLEVDCIDFDEEALVEADIRIRGANLQSICKTVKRDFLRINYRSEINFGLMIGVLCGLSEKSCITILKKVRRHLKSTSILIASNVMNRMKYKDTDMSYLLREEIGWHLIFKSEDDLKNIFQQAGYEWKGCFYDEPLKFHCMGIGTPKKREVPREK